MQRDTPAAMVVMRQCGRFTCDLDRAKRTLGNRPDRPAAPRIHFQTIHPGSPLALRGRYEVGNERR